MEIKFQNELFLYYYDYGLGPLILMNEDILLRDLLLKLYI